MSSFDREAETSLGRERFQAHSESKPTDAFFRINEPNVIYQTFEREVVAVHLNTGSYHTLAAIAGEAFLLFGTSGASARQVAAELAASYDAPAEAIEADLVAFLDQLLAQTMVVPIASGGQTPPPKEAAAQRAPYTAPRLESFSDLEGLVLIDPVHDVGAAGWPNVAESEMLDQPVASSPDAPGLPRLRCRLASANVIFERFAAETVAMDLGTGAYHSLSGPAEDVFLLFPNEPTTWEIRNALQKKYVVEPAELESALREYLNQLVQESLIVLEKLEDETAPDRELQLHDSKAGKPFEPPRLETFAQPSFDSTFNNETLFGHEQSAASSMSGSADRKTAEPYARRRYAIRHGDLLYSSAGGETVVADRDDGKYFKLNEAASDVFALLRQKPDVSEVASALRQKYAVKEHDLRVAVMILLWNLRKVGLASMEPADAQPPAERLAPETIGAAEPVPFPGFDVAMHHDLKDLLKPFNPAHEARPKPKAAYARQFLLLLEQYFEEAASAAGVSVESYQVAGEPMTIRCAGGAHAEALRRAFRHLKTDAVAAQGLTVSAWHHGAAPAGPFLESWLNRLYENWSLQCGPRGEVLDFHCDAIAAIYHPGPDVLSVLDRESGHAFYLMRDDAPLPFWELSSPFRHILHPYFSSRGLQYTHAGAVGTPKGGVLLAGKGGSGKSTTSLLCASAGMRYAADDYCLTNPQTGQVFSLYNTAKLKGRQDLERVPELAGRSFNEDSFEHGGVGKGTFNLSDLWPERMTEGFPVRAILLPTVTDQVESRLVPCSKGEALLSLAPSTLAQLPFSNQTDCRRLADLANSVPAYRLYLGSELSRIPALIRDRIQELVE